MALTRRDLLKNSPLISIVLGGQCLAGGTAGTKMPQKSDLEKQSSEADSGMTVNTAYDIPYLKIDVLGTDTSDVELEKTRKKMRGFGLWVTFTDSPYKENICDKEKIFAVWVKSFACGGKTFYLLNERTESESSRERAAVLFDAGRKTKTIFRYLEGNLDLQGLLSDKGDLLYLGLSKTIPSPPPSGAKGKIVKFGTADEPKESFELSESGGVYLIDLENNMRVKYHQLGNPDSNPQFTEDGNGFFANNRLVNVLTGQVKELRQVFGLSHYGYSLSPNGNYVAWRVGMFSANSWVDGQWGLEVITPKGNFLLSSPELSLNVKQIQDDGTIIDHRGYVLKPENDTYKCIKSEADAKTLNFGPLKPLIDLQVRKL